jgi:hypothetical protein
MLHPIFSTLIQRPDLVLGHVSAYGALFSQEARQVGSQLVLRAVAGLLAVVCGSVFLSLTGVAVMLGFLHQFHWALVAVPGAALVMLIIAVMQVKKPLVDEQFTELKAQFASDADALRNAA